MSFQKLLTAMPPELQNEVTEMDTFLKSLRPLKFKRTADKRKINYVAPEHGVSYAILPTDIKPIQHFGWYYLHDKEANKWYRKTDYLETILAEIVKTDPTAAEYIFNSLNECTQCKVKPCSAISYTHGGKQKLACYGRVIMSLFHEDFKHVREFFRQLNTLVTQKEN